MTVLSSQDSHNFSLRLVKMNCSTRSALSSFDRAISASSVDDGRKGKSYLHQPLLARVFRTYRQ